MFNLILYPILDQQSCVRFKIFNKRHFLKVVPGCYFIVGAHNAQKGAHYPHHHPRFTIDEDAMPTAIEVLARAAMNFLK